MLIIFLTTLLALYICIYAYSITQKEYCFVTLQKKQYHVDSRTLFAAFTLMTAPNFIFHACELKYLCWIALVSYLLLSKKYDFHVCDVTWWLSIVIIDVLIGVVWGGHWLRGSMMLVKYLILIFFFSIGFNIDIDNKKLTFIFQYALRGIVLALVFASGMTMLLVPPMYWVTNLFFFGQAGISDCFTVFVPICLSSALLLKNKKYVLIALLCLLSDICFVVRTGIGGWFIATAVYMGLRKQIKMLFLMLILLLLAILSFIYITPIRNKTYSQQIQERFASEGFGSYLFERENLMDSGRQGIHDAVLAHLPAEKGIFGYGSGTTNDTLRRLNKQYGIAAIMHNDYAVMLIDNGVVGISLWIGLLLSLYIRIIKVVFTKNNSELTRILGITAASSLAGATFAMHYDNVLAHSMSSIGIPFLLLGMFYRSMHNDRRSRALP